VGVDVSAFFIFYFGYEFFTPGNNIIYAGGDGLRFVLAEAFGDRSGRRSILIE
jgi:hypothetical protein